MDTRTIPRTFAKPLAARQVEARARAKQLGVRVAVVSEARSYVSASQSAPGVTYRIERSRHGWGCECGGFLWCGQGGVDEATEGDSTTGW